MLFLRLFPFFDFYKNLKCSKKPQKKNIYNISIRNLLIYRSKTTCKIPCKNLPRLAKIKIVQDNTLKNNYINLASFDFSFVNIFQHVRNIFRIRQQAGIGFLQSPF